jgi:hypothetical protein
MILEVFSPYLLRPIKLYHGGSVWWNKTTHLMAAEKRKNKRKKSSVPLSSLRHAPSDQKISLLALPPEVSNISQ